MSNFEYPIQIDDSVYTKSINDLDYNRIVEYLENNTDWDSTLKKIRNNLKLGIEDKFLNKKAFEYTLILRYFNNLSNYCRKATTEEKNNLYCNFIQCLENIAICKSNPKIIRDLAEMLCMGFTATIDCSCITYTYDISTYDITNVIDKGCSDIVLVNSSVGFPASSSTIYIYDNVDYPDLSCGIIEYRLSALSGSSGYGEYMYRLLPPFVLEPTKSIIIYNTGDDSSGRFFTEAGSYLDSSWNFNINHKKQYLAPYRRYLFRYINNEWYVDDIHPDKYVTLNWEPIYYSGPPSNPPMIFKGGIHYNLLGVGGDLSSQPIYLDNPEYNKGLYIRVTRPNFYSNNPTLDTGTQQIVLTVGIDLEFLSDGTQWILQ